MKRRFEWPSPTMVIACLALFFSLTGASIAASHYLITSTSQIKPSVISKLRGNRGPQGNRGSQGVQGIQGSQGVTGATGAKGATGSSGIANITEVQGADLSLGSGYYGAPPIASCPSGYVVVGTGFY